MSSWLSFPPYATSWRTIHYLSMPLIILAGLIISAVSAQLSRRRMWYLLIIPFYLGSQFNVFAGHFLNALFLNAFGTGGTAVIVHSQEKDSQLNNKNVWAYDAVLKTADDRDVVVHFDTISASIYPIRNPILIAPENEPFVAKYIPWNANQGNPPPYGSA